MESKEKIEALNYTWFYDPTCQEEANKRETIIKELKKDLEVLEEIRKTFKVEKEETINQNRYWLYIGNHVYMITRKIYDLVKKLLEGE